MLPAAGPSVGRRSAEAKRVLRVASRAYDSDSDSAGHLEARARFDITNFLVLLSVGEYWTDRVLQASTDFHLRTQSGAMARTGILALPPELLDLVFRRIVRWHESEIFLERDRCTLAALARTCRTFHDPALDILWYELSSLLPLLSTLPPDLCVITRENNASDELHESVVRA